MTGLKGDEIRGDGDELNRINELGINAFELDRRIYSYMFPDGKGVDAR